MSHTDNIGSDPGHQAGDLAAIQLFEGIPRDAVLTALHGSAVIDLPAGRTLLQPGDSNSSMYILLAGEMVAHLDARNQDGTAIRILAGECVGELSALDGKPASALVRAVTDVKLLELPAVIFRDQILTLPGVAGNLLLALAERMRKANTAALNAQREQLEVQHMRKELRIARQLQLDTVPPLQCPLFPHRRDIEACGLLEPAAKVGGDLFDCFFVDRKHLFFCIGDVSGQGMAAALFVSRVVGVVRMLAHEYVMDPSSLLSAVNSRLCEGNEASIFVALFCGYLHVDSGRVCYSNAGHCAPLLAWDSGSKRLPVPKGALLGAISSMSYLTGDIVLAPGDLLLCHTDGLAEATNHAQDEFGEQRLQHLLATHGKEALPALMARVRTQLDTFMADAHPEDDYTLLALRRPEAAGHSAHEPPLALPGTGITSVGQKP
jgi:phosphoserine phosphatase RsbU/P